MMRRWRRSSRQERGRKMMRKRKIGERQKEKKEAGEDGGAVGRKEEER